MTVSSTKDWSDLDLSFIAHPTTGDIVRKTGEDAIKRSIRNLIMTMFYEIPFQSYIGSNVRKLLFENVTPLTANFLTDAIRSVIEQFEPRVALRAVNVSVSEDANGFDVTISYVILNTSAPATISFFLSRLR